MHDMDIVDAPSGYEATIASLWNRSFAPLLICCDEKEVSLLVDIGRIMARSQVRVSSIVQRGCCRHDLTIDSSSFCLLSVSAERWLGYFNSSILSTTSPSCTC
jgi:hypothetical protein